MAVPQNQNVHLENVEKTKKQNEIPNETGSANGASIYGS